MGIPRPDKSHVLSGSVRIALIVGIQAFLALVFWFGAARLATSRELGLAAALYTSLQFVNYLTGMGLTVMLARFGGGAGHNQDALFGWSIVCTSAASFIGTLGYLAIVASPSTDLLRGHAIGYLAFFLLTAGMSVGLLVDVRLIAGRSWRWLTIKNVLIGMVRLPLVLVHPIGNEALWLFALIAGPQAVFGVAGVFVLPSVMGGRVRLHRPEAWRHVVRFSATNWLAVLAIQAPTFVLPLIVALHVPASVNASFFLAFSIAVGVSLAPSAISLVVLVEGARSDLDFRHRSRQALMFAVSISTAALVGSALFFPIVTTVYGSAYQLAADILPVLIFACIPLSIAVIRLSEARLRYDHLTTVAITLTLGIGIVGLAVVLVPPWGAWGAVLAWVAGNSAAAVVGVVLGRVRWRSPPPIRKETPPQSSLGG